MRLSPQLLRVAGRVTAIAGVILAVLAVRVVTASHAELQAADGLRASGDVDGAISRYRRAASWYAPGNPYVEEALDRLADIATEAQESAEPERALSAWRGVRSAILSSRSFYTPHAGRLERANAAIATLMSQEAPPPMDAGSTAAERRREHLALLERDPRPSLVFTLMLLAGFATWVGAAFAFSTRAFDEEDRLVPRAARRWGTTFIVGFGLFVLGMLLA